MINIISKSINSSQVSGPKKVVENLIKGLDLLGYPYVVNQGLDSCKRLWIHDDISALSKIASLDNKIKTVIGPNLYILPRQISELYDISRAVYLHPSQWVCDYWKYLGFNRCALDCWPTGIDTDLFKPSLIKKEKVLIYFKQRRPEELIIVEDLLRSKYINFEIIIYGQYSQSDYLKTLQNTKYIIWIGCHESQGIAFEESLSMNIPVLVWDVNEIKSYNNAGKENSIFNKFERGYQNATSAYYFDYRCGIKINLEKELNDGIDLMEKKWSELEPRQYILENLSLEKQARDFINLFEKYYGLTYNNGLEEKILNSKKWINSKWYFIIYIKFKDFIKKIIK